MNWTILPFGALFLVSFAAFAQSTNPTGAIGGSTNPTGAVRPTMPAPSAPSLMAPGGPATGAGGQTVRLPDGSLAIARPNGNGTTTITHTDGTTETLSKPR